MICRLWRWCILLAAVVADSRHSNGHSQWPLQSTAMSKSDHEQKKTQCSGIAETHQHSHQQSLRSVNREQFIERRAISSSIRARLMAIAVDAWEKISEGSLLVFESGAAQSGYPYRGRSLPVRNCCANHHRSQTARSWTSIAAQASSHRDGRQRPSPRQSKDQED